MSHPRAQQIEANPQEAEQYIARLIKENERLRKGIRAIELNVDAINMKGFTPKPAEKAAFGAIKGRCRELLTIDN